MSLSFSLAAGLPVAPARRGLLSARRPRMAASGDEKEFRGFGEKPAPKKKRSAGQMRREAASARYDEMAAAGMPEYSIWVRLKDAPRPPGSENDPDFPPMPWLPAGSLAVPRSSQVAAAIFEAEDDLLEGAYRLYPNLKKEPLANIEYGFQLKEFPDEDVRTAERPPQKGGWQARLREFFGRIQSPLNEAR